MPIDISGEADLVAALVLIAVLCRPGTPALVSSLAVLAITVVFRAGLTLRVAIMRSDPLANALLRETFAIDFDAGLAIRSGVGDPSPADSNAGAVGQRPFAVVAVT